MQKQEMVVVEKYVESIKKYITATMYNNDPCYLEEEDYYTMLEDILSFVTDEYKSIALQLNPRLQKGLEVLDFLHKNQKNTLLLSSDNDVNKKEWEYLCNWIERYTYYNTDSYTNWNDLYCGVYYNKIQRAFKLTNVITEIDNCVLFNFDDFE